MRRFLTLSVLALIASAAALTGPVSETAQANGQDCGAGANGSQGYAYAGHQASRVAHGIRATITPTASPNVVSGHVAGWIGVGGPGQGANGQTLWLQVGVASIPDTPTMVYAEITRGGQQPVFVPLVRKQPLILDEIQHRHYVKLDAVVLKASGERQFRLQLARLVKLPDLDPGMPLQRSVLTKSLARRKQELNG